MKLDLACGSNNTHSSIKYFLPLRAKERDEASQNRINSIYRCKLRLVELAG